MESHPPIEEHGRAPDALEHCLSSLLLVSQVMHDKFKTAFLRKIRQGESQGLIFVPWIELCGGGDAQATACGHVGVVTFYVIPRHVCVTHV